MSTQPTLFLPPESIEPTTQSSSRRHLISDRGSKYTLTIIKISDRSEVKTEMKKLLLDKAFRKATHNTYARRVNSGSGAVLDGKNDDGETGGGMCVLRELRRGHLVNCLVIVTRYYGGVKLGTDRYRHLVDATRYAVDFLTKQHKKDTLK